MSVTKTLATIALVVCAATSSCRIAAAEVIHFDPASALIPVNASSARLATRLGLQIHLPKTQTVAQTRAQIAIAHDLGFSFVRADLFWARVEPSRGTYTFESFDPIVAAAKERAMGVLWTLDYGNEAYGTPGYGNTNAADADSPAFRAAIGAYATYAATAAKHFSGENVRYEIWNEPDRNAALAGPSPDAAPLKKQTGDAMPLYGEMFASAIKAMRSADPRAEITTGGVSNFQAPLLPALVGSSDATGASAIGVHPYRSHRAPETLGPDVRMLRNSIVSSPASGARIWDTEWGYSAFGDFPATFGDGHAEAARDRQAVYDVRELLALWRADLPLAVLYELQDGGNDPRNREDNFGLLDASGARKPAYLAVAQLLRVAAATGYLGRYSHVPPGLQAMRLDNEADDGYTVIVWLDTPGAVADVAVAVAPCRVDDVFGTQVGLRGESSIHVTERSGPVYLRFAPSHVPLRN